MGYKVLFLADISSTHTRKWAFALSAKGIEVKVFCLDAINTERFSSEGTARIAKLYSGMGNEAPFSLGSNYVQAISRVKKIIKTFRPDIVHCHYATSYGLLGAMSGFHPLIISVWGSDIYSFPQKSFVHKALLKYNLNKADKILSTSRSMAAEAKKYTHKEIEVSPFGIDIAEFRPKAVESVFDKESIVVGAVKQFKPVYANKDLILAFDMVRKKHPELPLKLLLVGSGPMAGELKQFVKELNLEDCTKFTGFIPPDKVVDYHNMMAVEVFPSLQESFGVSVLEASACGRPVIASNIGGLPEVVNNNETGLLVPPSNPEKLAEATEKLVVNKELRTKMGEKGRVWVEQNYNWNNCVEQMIGIYKKIINTK